ALHILPCLLLSGCIRIDDEVLISVFRQFALNLAHNRAGRDLPLCGWATQIDFEAALLDERAHGVNLTVNRNHHWSFFEGIPPKFFPKQCGEVVGFEILLNALLIWRHTAVSPLSECASPLESRRNSK